MMGSMDDNAHTRRNVRLGDTMTDGTTTATAYQTQQIDGIAHITLADYARMHNANGDRLRGMARDGKLPDARQLFGNTWIIPHDADAPPAATARATARPDGRKPYTVYLDADEHAHVSRIIPAANIIDPRAVSRAKRATAKSATDNATE